MLKFKGMIVEVAPSEVRAHAMGQMVDGLVVCLGGRRLWECSSVSDYRATREVSCSHCTLIGGSET